MSEVTSRYLGLDVHKDTIAIAIAEDSGPPVLYGEIPNDPAVVRRLVAKLGEGRRLEAAYEAGPTGFVLHRQLIQLGVEAVVVAPSLMPRRPGDRVKTDGRDALTLARLLRSGDLTAVWVPDSEHEALRNLVRARYVAKADLLRAQHRVVKLLLREGVRAPDGVRAWSARHRAWINQLQLLQPLTQLVFEDYRAEVNRQQERLHRIEGQLRQAAAASPQLHTITALQALRGVGLLTAVTIVSEAGDLRRFRNAPALMAFAGLVGSEHSSGHSRQQGRLTKTGNAKLRHVLIQAAHNARFAPATSVDLRRRLADAPPDLVELSWRAQQRLHHRYWHLQRRLGGGKAFTAVARELAGFIWAVGQR
jgi:transposase